MIHTILQILVYQLLFLAVYDLFLKKETFFSLNRVYLLLTPILSVFLPFISFGFIQQNIPQEYIVQLPAVMIGEVGSETGINSAFWLPTLTNLWIIGIIGSTLIFCLKILKIMKLKSQGSTQNIQGIRLTILPTTDTAFSFYDTIYLGEDISEENKEEIVSHEKVHIQQKHSLDLLYFELLRIVFWFNPLVYLFQNRISTLHEYIADAEIILQKDKKEYYQSLLSEVFQTAQISFINTFFNQSLIKKRILMLQKSKSPKIKMMKYLLLFPIIFGMLVYTSCSNDPKPEETQTLQKSDAEVMAEIIAKEEDKIRLYTIAAKADGEMDRNNIVVQVDTIMGGEKIGDVPYSVIEQVPTYPGCSGDNETMKVCMSTKIAEFINKNFNTEIVDDLNLSGRQRIAVQFKIDKTGKVVDVRARAKSREYENEAVRVVEMLPQMIPGEQKGEKVGVIYSLPIIFDVVE